MIRKIVPIVTVVLLLSLQVFFHSIFGLVEALPDLIPIALAIVAIRWGMGGAAVFGFVAGMIEDSFATTLLGLNSLSWILAGTFGSSIRRSLFGNRIAVAVILVALLKAIHEIVYYTIYLWNTPGDMLTRIFLQTPIASVYSAGMALVIFIILDRFELD